MAPFDSDLRRRLRLRSLQGLPSTLRRQKEATPREDPRSFPLRSRANLRISRSHDRRLPRPEGVSHLRLRRDPEQLQTDREDREFERVYGFALEGLPGRDHRCLSWLQVRVL